MNASLILTTAFSQPWAGAYLEHFETILLPLPTEPMRQGNTRASSVFQHLKTQGSDPRA
jgi:hypothetical protein